MKTAARWLLAISAVSIVGASATLLIRAQGGRQVVERHIYGESGAAMPATLAELWRSAPVIVQGVFQGDRSADVSFPNRPGEAPDTLVRTIYRLQLLEVYKPDQAWLGITPQDIEVVRLGGVRDRGSYDEAILDGSFPAFKRGEQYVLFLEPSEEQPLYHLYTGGPESAFLIQGDRVVRRGRSKLSQELSDLNSRDLTALLRSKRGGRQ